MRPYPRSGRTSWLVRPLPPPVSSSQAELVTGEALRAGGLVQVQGAPVWCGDELVVSQSVALSCRAWRGEVEREAWGGRARARPWRLPEQPEPTIRDRKELLKNIFNGS